MMVLIVLSTLFNLAHAEQFSVDDMLAVPAPIRIEGVEYRATITARRNPGPKIYPSAGGRIGSPLMATVSLERGDGKPETSLQISAFWLAYGDAIWYSEYTDPDDDRWQRNEGSHLAREARSGPEWPVNARFFGVVQIVDTHSTYYVRTPERVVETAEKLGTELSAIIEKLVK